MTDIELKSCIGTIEMLRRLHGVMNVIDADNCEKIIKVLSDIPKYKDAYNKGWDDGAKATYEHLKMCEEETKTGHWEWVQYDYNPKIGNWHCSECRCIVVECVDKEEKGGIPLYKYCPQCGAKMFEPHESEDKE